MNTTPRTLSRSLNDRMIAGVMGGIAHRFGWNPTLVRSGSCSCWSRSARRPSLASWST